MQSRLWPFGLCPELGPMDRGEPFSRDRRSSTKRLLRRLEKNECVGGFSVAYGSESFLRVSYRVLRPEIERSAWIFPVELKANVKRTSPGEEEVVLSVLHEAFPESRVTLSWIVSGHGSACQGCFQRLRHFDTNLAQMPFLKPKKLDVSDGKGFRRQL